MKTTFYTVIENQEIQAGVHTLLYNHCDDENQAYAKYYTVLATAAVSEIPYHAAHILRSDGTMIEGKVFDRRFEPSEEQ